jgi:glycine/D-amino acid oxidase-like deaminating enzyme
MRDYRRFSFWLDSVPDDLTPRPALDSDIDVDVAIVGAGYTGLWTAYYLVTADPKLRIAIVESEIAGFGASGRNGGWASALFSADSDRLERRFGRTALTALQRAMFATVDEIGRVAGSEGLDVHFSKGGTLSLATNPAHLQTLKTEVSHHRARGFSEDDYRWLDAAAAAERVDVAGSLGGAYTPHCAVVHPARLARGLARVVESRGVRIFEQTPALDLTPGAVRAAGGRVRADVVVRATEAYTPRLPGLRRSVLPIYSLMIATEPLPQSFWDHVGWHGRETLTDGRHLLIYAQRTADGRIAMGGRGAPYHFASSVDDDFDRDSSVFAGLHRVLGTLFPALGDAAVTHRWGGPIAVARDWISSVGLDRQSGLAWAGGYAGDGVSTANLAGRTLRDLILERHTELVRLPWVNHRSRTWEPEPLRWLGARAAQWAVASADGTERRSGRPARRSRLVARLIGREI